MDDNKQVGDANLEKWRDMEQMFLRVLGADLLILAGLGLIFGIIYNANNEIVITMVNIVFSILLALGGAWTLYTSRKLENIEKMIDGYLNQESDNSTIYAGILSVFAFLFLLEGVSRGQIVMLLLAVTMFGIAGFFVWRGRQIKNYQ